MTPVLLSITSMIPTGGSLAEALEFYTHDMGFSIVWQGDRAAGVQRGKVSFTLIENSNREWANNASFSIGVSDIDALYREYVSGPARVGPLETKSWGRSEFHMVVPSGVCLQFYQQEI